MEFRQSSGNPSQPAVMGLHLMETQIITGHWPVNEIIVFISDIKVREHSSETSPGTAPGRGSRKGSRALSSLSVPLKAWR